VTGPAAVSCEGVWKSYRIYHQRSHSLKEKVLSRRNMYEDFWALKGVDLEVPEGATIGILGANGSGKSTLLKTMAGILSPNRGSVEVRGSISPLLELGTGFHPELTGRENVFLGGSLLGRDRRTMEKLYDEIVDFAGIGNFMDIPVKNYSSGMYARLAFAVAVSVDPDILIIDEVLAVGDEQFQMRCHRRMADLRAGGRTVVIVSHNLETIRSLCSSAAWVDKGVIRQLGEPHDVTDAYLGRVHADASEEAGTTAAAGSKRFGSGEAEITAVEFLDGRRSPGTAFRTSEPLTIRLRYRSTEPIRNVSCGVAVFNAATLAYLFGQSTEAAGMSLTLAEEGTIELSIPSLPLLTGNYVVTVALEVVDDKRVVDLHDRRYSFFVSHNPALPHEAGLIHVDSEWKVDPSTVPA
jgi:lipopolysaccharide transport system ATP-binding protein